jgi:deoxyribonuclease I
MASLVERSESGQTLRGNRHDSLLVSDGTWRIARQRSWLALALAALSACGGGSSNDGITPPPPPPPPTCNTAVPANGSITGLPNNYYVSATGKCGANLVAALHQVVKNHRVLGYTFARDSLYAFVDRGNMAEIVDVYAGKVATGVVSRATAAQFGFNTEHAWPRSRGAENDPALSDLNHLFTSDETANTNRNNHPFGVVTGQVSWSTTPVNGEQSKLGFDATGAIVFEPRASRRGDLARALFYFYVRYKPQPPSGFSLQNFTKERELLLAWHAADPPDDYERARNNAVYRAQGNRNPFIDWPVFATAIGVANFN